MAEDLVAVGRVGRPHGLDGSFFVEHPSEDPARFAKGATLYAAGERLQVVGSKRARGRPVIRLERPVARGTELAVPRSELAEPEEDSYYVFQLIGLDVVDEQGATLGRVAGVTPSVANDVLVLDTGLALPMHEECVRQVDLQAGRIVIAPGYFERG